MVAQTLAGARLRAAEPELVAQKANASLDLESETRLEIRGIQGRMLLRLGAPGQLRFGARTLTGAREDRPIALWAEGSTLRLLPVAGHEAERLYLEVGIPPSLEVRVEARDSQIDLTGLAGSVTLQGSKLLVVAATLAASSSFDIQGGQLALKAVNKDVTVHGAGLEVEAQGVTGAITLQLKEGKVTLAHVSDVEARIENTAFQADDVRGVLNVQADGGPGLKLKGCTGGGDLNLSGAPLEMVDSKGNFEVQTDAAAAFQIHEGDLHVVAQGATVRASQIRGPFVLEADNGEIGLEELTGPTEIRGSDLKLSARTSHGDLTIEVASSDLQIENAMTKLRVANEYGDIAIHGALQHVEIDSRNGAVQIDDFKGWLDLEADGPTVEVQWSQFGGAENSSVSNASGDLRIGLPPQGSFRLEAHAPYGHIESELAGVLISQDGHYASLAANAARTAPQVQHASITLNAGKDLYLIGGAPAARPAPRR
jgi:hypothetical protein